MNIVHPNGLRNLTAVHLLILLFGLAGLAQVPAAPRTFKMPVAPQWSRFEHSFRSTIAYSNPVQDATLTVVFTSPLGDVIRVPGFWDGGKTWRVRFSPDMPGHWTFHSSCSEPMNDGLQNQTGEFMCTSALGQSRFDEHGLVRVARDHRHLEHSDGKQFFWAADTVWSGARVSQQLDWEKYAQIRLAQGFNTVAWAATPGLDEKGEAPTTGFPEQIGINVDYFQRLDAKVAALANAGLLSAIVPFSDAEWTATGGPVLAESQVALLVRYVVARYGGDPVVWVLPIEPEAKSKRNWRELGKGLFGEIWHAPVMLYAGIDGPWQEFVSEKWVDMFGFKFTQAFTDDALQAAFNGPLALAAKEQPGRPVVTVTPFENALARPSKRFSADDVRHAAYWGVMISGGAGVTYGAFGVSHWDQTKGRPDETAGELPFWRKALFMNGAKQIGHFANLMNSLGPVNLRPDSSIVATQPGEQSPSRRAVAMRSQANDLALVYVPAERSIELVLDLLPASPAVNWFNPRTGETTPAVAVVSGKTAQFPTPGPGDWLLVLKKGKK